MEILVIGCGVVGSNVKKILERKFKVDVVDKFKPQLTTYNKNKIYDIAYIAVDTPFNEKGVCDTSEVFNAVRDNNANIFVIKSTILPGTTDKIISETEKHVVFSPEFYGGTQHCNNFDFDFTILGGEKSDCIKVQQMLQNVFDARHKFRITDTKTAELTKYMENSYLATKVTFCNEFYRIAQNYGVEYEDLRELVTLDPRIDPSHTFVYRDHPYFDTHCLNKDVPAIAEDSNSEFLKNVININKKFKMEIKMECKQESQEQKILSDIQNEYKRISILNENLIEEEIQILRNNLYVKYPNEDCFYIDTLIHDIFGDLDTVTQHQYDRI